MRRFEMNMFRKILMYFTLQEREKRLYDQYERDRRQLEALTEREQHERYVTLKTTLEYRKQVFLFVIAGIVLSSITGLWKSFFDYFKTSIQLYLDNINTLNESKLIWVISSFLVIMAILVLFVSVIIYLRNTYAVYRKLLIVEKIIKE